MITEEIGRNKRKVPLNLFFISSIMCNGLNWMWLLDLDENEILGTNLWPSVRRCFRIQKLSVCLITWGSISLAPGVGRGDK